MRESPAGLSMLKTYMSCPRRWAFKYLMGWKRKNEKESEALVIGSALHDAIEDYYTNGSKSLSSIRGTITQPAWQNRFDRMWSKWLEEWSTIEHLTPLEVEAPYSFTLPNGFPMTFRVDRIMQDENGYIYIVDTKTTKGSLGQMESQYMFDAQPIVYHNVGYFLRPEWASAFRGWLTDIIMCRNTGNAQHRLSEPVFYAREEVTEFSQNLANLTGDIKYSIEMAKAENSICNAFPAYRGYACRSYNSTCPFMETCLRAPPLDSEPLSAYDKDDPEFLETVHAAFKEIKDD